MDKLRELNALRKQLETERKALEVDVYLLADEKKEVRLKKCRKHIKQTKKLIFSMIDAF